MCLEKVEATRFAGETKLSTVVNIIKNECPALQRCDYNLKRYAYKKLEDDEYIYSIKVKTIERYLAETDEDDLPNPSYADLFLQY